MLTLVGFLLLFSGFPCDPARMADDDERRHDEVVTLLREGQDLAANERHEEALQKFEKYFVASRETPGQGGVRLSFALSYWKELGDVYPPALDALKRARETARREFRKAGCDEFWWYHEFVSLNRTLGEQSDTVKEFLAVHEKDKARAARLYGVSEAALIEAREFTVAGEYIDPLEAWANIVEMRALNQRYLAERGDDQHAARMKSYEDRSFTHATTTLIALLVVNDRAAEAEEVARRAREEWDDKLFAAAIERALKGEIPRPWP